MAVPRPASRARRAKRSGAPGRSTRATRLDAQTADSPVSAANVRVHMDAAVAAPGGVARDGRSHLTSGRPGVPARGAVGMARVSVPRRVHPGSCTRRWGKWIRRGRSGLLADQEDVAKPGSARAGWQSEQGPTGSRRARGTRRQARAADHPGRRQLDAGLRHQPEPAGTRRPPRGGGARRHRSTCYPKRVTSTDYSRQG